MKKLTAILAGLSAVAFASTAQAQTATITYTGTPAVVPASNDFRAYLGAAPRNLTGYVTANNATISLSGPANLSFEYLGSESGFFDTFTAGTGGAARSFSETSSGLEDRTGSPFLFGFVSYAGGLLNNLTFSTTNSSGINASLTGAASSTNDPMGFGIFIPCGASFARAGEGCATASGASYSEFYLGYDDQVNHSDDNHDDFLVRVRVNAPVPEPATWAMMLVGFGAVGFGMRRSTRKTALRAA